MKHTRKQYEKKTGAKSVEIGASTMTSYPQKRPLKDTKQRGPRNQFGID